ncbi:MAG: YggS family pyridoxal phosphate-dependent enzyme [Mycobacteriales bacterium]|nr:YggS family pyridoxal phosphate-dependent enzyme [Mycobacteriales bacterium]
MTRREDLAAGLAEVTQRISAACRAAGREPSEVALIAVSKTWPASDVRLLQDLGVTRFGENRDAEARDKAAALAERPPTWHFVGAVQSSKAASVARYTDVVHSLDRTSLLTALDRGAVAAGRTLDVLLQLSLDGDPARGGAVAADLPGLADAVEAAQGLRLKGVMAVAPRGAEPATAFAELARVAALLRADHPAATELSAGMSGDLEQAVAHGATLVRVGTALLGHRTPPLR